MPRKSPKRKPERPSRPPEEVFEDVLRANEAIADEGAPLEPDQTHHYEAGKPVRDRFSIC